MLTIYKYPLHVDDNDIAEVVMPHMARVLTVQAQHETPCIWAVVDTEREPVKRRFRVFGTGHPMKQDYSDYIGTFQLMGGSLIFHLFEDHTINISDGGTTLAIEAETD